MELLKNIDNIIFDFGGVIFDINPQLSLDAFSALGVTETKKSFAEFEQVNFYEQFETGKIDAEEFREHIRKLAGVNLSDFEIDYAWNKLLIGMPEENLPVLQKLKMEYPLYLLSNTSIIHSKRFEQIIHDQHGIFLADLFNKVYYSYELGLRKPGAAIFSMVIEENKLVAERTLFIDDVLINIEGAKKVGLQTLFLEKGKTIHQIFC